MIMWINNMGIPLFGTQRQQCTTYTMNQQSTTYSRTPPTIGAVQSDPLCLQPWPTYNGGAGLGGRHIFNMSHSHTSIRANTISNGFISCLWHSLATWCRRGSTRSTCCSITCTLLSLHKVLGFSLKWVVSEHDLLLNTVWSHGVSQQLVILSSGHPNLPQWFIQQWMPSWLAGKAL